MFSLIREYYEFRFCDVLQLPQSKWTFFFKYTDFAQLAVVPTSAESSMERCIDMLQMSLEVYLQFINYAREQGTVEQP